MLIHEAMASMWLLLGDTRLLISVPVLLLVTGQILWRIRRRRRARRKRV